MHNLSNASGKIVFVLLLVFLACCAVPSQVISTSVNENERNELGALEMPWQPGAERYQSSSFVYQMFTGDEMSDAYDFCFGGYQHVTWMRASKEAWRVGAGALIGDGTPLFPDTTWEVSSSELFMLMIPLEVAFLYNFKDNPSEKSVAPYVGIGVGGFIGFEKMAVEMSRFGGAGVEWSEARFRYVLGGHAIVGTTIKITEKYRALLEVRWTQSGKGSTVKNEFSDEEIAQGWLEVEKAAQRPDFNFTSWSVSVGLQW